jgi:hypothetical protein
MVIRVEKTDGEIKELKNIQWIESATEDFIPPNDYEDVSTREFFIGTPELRRYQED